MELYCIGTYCGNSTQKKEQRVYNGLNKHISVVMWSKATVNRVTNNKTEMSASIEMDRKF